MGLSQGPMLSPWSSSFPPYGASSTLGLQKTHQAQPSFREATWTPPARAIVGVMEAFPGVVSHHQSPGHQTPVINGHSEPSKDNPPSLPQSFGNCSHLRQVEALSLVSCPGPDVPQGGRTGKKYVVLIYKVVLVHSSFIPRKKKCANWF